MGPKFYIKDPKSKDEKYILVDEDEYLNSLTKEELIELVKATSYGLRLFMGVEKC